MNASLPMGATPAPQAPDRRIPVYLVTGFLGSGKTTLLAKWLGEPLLADAITVVNEYGEVGLDDRLLATANDVPNMVAGGCVCCTGLAGLAETLEELFWARLHRDIAQFSCVVIETTGLAEPQPIAQSFADRDLLRERFVLKATITTVAATAGETILRSHESSRAQIEGADVVVITKADLADEPALAALASAVDTIHAGIPVLRSARGSLSLSQVLSHVGGPAQDCAHHDHAAHRDGSGHGGAGDLDGPAAGSDTHGENEHAQGHEHEHDHGHDHLDGIKSLFVPTEQPLLDEELVALVELLRSTHGASLLRAKGIVPLAHGGHAVVQMSPNESFYDIAPLNEGAAADGKPIKLGMTVILKQA